MEEKLNLININKLLVNTKVKTKFKKTHKTEIQNIIDQKLFKVLEKFAYLYIFCSFCKFLILNFCNFYNFFLKPSNLIIA